MSGSFCSAPLASETAPGCCIQQPVALCVSDAPLHGHTTCWPTLLLNLSFLRLIHWQITSNMVVFRLSFCYFSYLSLLFYFISKVAVLKKSLDVPFGSFCWLLFSSLHSCCPISGEAHLKYFQFLFTRSSISVISESVSIAGFLILFLATEFLLLCISNNFLSDARYCEYHTANVWIWCSSLLSLVLENSSFICKPAWSFQVLLKNFVREALKKSLHLV